jgi:flagellin
MIGGVNYASSQLASIYNTGNQQLASTLTKIASGKKFQNAAEDLLGFIRSNKLSTEISGYQKVKENLTEFKTLTSAAVQAGGAIYEDLTKLKTLAQQYESAADDDQKAEYKAEFDSLKTKISKTLGNSKVDGKDIMQTTESIASVVLNPQGNSTLTMQFTNVSSSTDIDALELAAEEEGGGEGGGECGGEGGGTATSVVDQIDAEIENMLSYLSEAKAFDAIASQQLKLNDTIISSKEAVKSLITDIDEAAETSRMIDESVRQQAAVSMIAQANMSRQSVLKLYM